MSLTLRALLLLLFASVCAQAQNRTLALYANSTAGLDGESRTAMRNEVQRLLSPAGLEVVWRDAARRAAGEDFELVAVASFQFGPAGASLADTSIADGRIIPFFNVECMRVMQMLGPRVDSTTLGRALGRIIAHEIYHIVARTTDHHDTGVAKAAFSVRDLTNPRFDFDAWSLARMRPSVAGLSADGSSATGRE
jgi:hypothetical protein